MLAWTLIFLGLAIIAAIFGFGSISSVAAGIAQFLFILFAALFVAAVLAQVFQRPSR